MKKIFLLSVIVGILGINIASVSFAAEAEKNPAERLIGMGIMEESYDLNGNVTRGEFAEILARLYGNLSDSYVAESYFSDVTGLSDKEMVKAINMLASLGIFKGYSDDTFRADIPVTRDEIIVSLIRVLGYESVAEIEGGYMTGYYSVAASKQLTSGLSSSDTVNYAAAVMLDNALEIEVMNQSLAGGRVQLNSGDILMEALLKTETCRGVVKAVGEMALSEDVSVGTGYIRIDDRIFAYECQFDEAQKLIGRTVDAYYSIEDGETVYYVEDTNRDTVITAELGEDTVFANNTLTYYDGTREKSISVVAAPYIVYNGRPVTVMPELGQTGTITAIRDDNGKYDILIIEEYKTYVTNSVFEGGMGIVARYVDEQLPLLSDVKELYIFDESGANIEASSIEPNDVLSLFAAVERAFWAKLKLWAEQSTRITA